MTASHVLCFSCICMELNFQWITFTIRSISVLETGRVRDCSRNKFFTCVVNSEHAYIKTDKALILVTSLYGFVRILLRSMNFKCLSFLLWLFVVISLRSRAKIDFYVSTNNNIKIVKFQGGLWTFFIPNPLKPYNVLNYFSEITQKVTTMCLERFSKVFLDKKFYEALNVVTKYFG